LGASGARGPENVIDLDEAGSPAPSRHTT